MQPIGKLTLNANPTNFFAETEQVAFHTGHLVPGIEVTNDPLLQGRNFSYLDTQLTRLGGPNFTQIPINRPHAPVNDNAPGRHAPARPIHTGVAPYTPNSSTTASPVAGGLVRRRVRATCPGRSRARSCAAAPASFDDHFSQAAHVLREPLHVEQAHIIDAYTFELGKCYEQAIKERGARGARRRSTRTCARRWPPGSGCRCPDGGAGRARCRVARAVADRPTPFPIAGRMVGVVAGPDADLSGIAKLRTALEAEGAQLR